MSNYVDYLSSLSYQELLAMNGVASQEDSAKIAHALVNPVPRQQVSTGIYPHGLTYSEAEMLNKAAAVDYAGRQRVRHMTKEAILAHALFEFEKEAGLPRSMSKYVSWAGKKIPGSVVKKNPAGEWVRAHPRGTRTTALGDKNWSKETGAGYREALKPGDKGIPRSRRKDVASNLRGRQLARDIAMGDPKAKAIAEGLKSKSRIRRAIAKVRLNLR